MADNIVNARIQNRYDIEASWASYDPVLYKGELAFSSDKGFQYKIGDGSSKWSALEYAQAGSLYGLTASIQELNYLSGATSNIQTQLDSKAESNKVGAALQVSGTTVRLVNAAGEILSTITTQDTTYTGGTGISISGTTINHSNSISAGSVSGSSGSVSEGGTVKIPSITYDAQGHITAASTTSITLPTVDLSGYLPLTGGTLTGQLLVKTNANPAIGVTGSSTSVSTWVKVTDANGAQVSFGIGTSNNKGLYDHDTSTWMFYKDSSNALHVGPSTVGSNTKPIYLNSGVPTAFSTTIGSGVIPVYLSSGALTASSSSVGSATQPVFLSSGTITALTTTVGSGTKPIYSNAGVLTVSSSTVGSATQPVYLSSGTITALSTTVGSGTTPIYSNAGVLTASSSTVGSSTKGVYLNSGTVTACSYAVGCPTYQVSFAEDTDLTTTFRSSITGSSDSAGFLAAIRSSTAISGFCTAYSAGVAFGRSDCQGFVWPAYSTAKAYVGGGNKDTIQWTRNIVLSTVDTAVGSATKPVYVDANGCVTASGSTVGSSTVPVYLNSGTITACSGVATSSDLSNYLPLSGGTLTGTVTMSTSSGSPRFYVKRTDTGQAVSMGLGSGGYNRGLYDDKQGKWLFYADEDNAVHINGTATVGGAAKPIYLSSGTPTACSSTVGSATQPVYMSSGTITACSTTVGSGTKPIYSSSGALTASSSTVGSSTTPVYLNSGTITACSAMVTSSQLTDGSVTKLGTSTYGSTSQPIYWNAGVPAALTATVGSGTKPIYSNAGVLTASSSTVGSATQPVYMSSGTITACSTTVGGTAKPIYSNGGVLTAISSSVGSGTQPCYLSSGTITACGSTVGSSTKPIYSSSGVLTACSSTVGSSTTPVYMSSGTITACSLSSTYAPYSDIYSGSNYTYFSDIPDDSYNRLTYLQYTSGTDSTAPDTSSYSDWWWNVISVGYSSRKLQLTACPFRNRPILYMRQKHDSSWYGWYEFHSTKIGTSAPSSLTTGEIYMVYSA